MTHTTPKYQIPQGVTFSEYSDSLTSSERSAMIAQIILATGLAYTTISRSAKKDTDLRLSSAIAIAESLGGDMTKMFTPARYGCKSK